MELINPEDLGATFAGTLTSIPSAFSDMEITFSASSLSEQTDSAIRKRPATTVTGGSHLNAPRSVGQ